MKFEELHKPFHTLDFDERLAFITSYTKNRTVELQKATVVVTTKPAARKTRAPAKDKQIKLTPDQLVLLRQLGLI